MVQISQLRNCDQSQKLTNFCRASVCFRFWWAVLDASKVGILNPTPVLRILLPAPRPFVWNPALNRCEDVLPNSNQDHKDHQNDVGDLVMKFVRVVLSTDKIANTKLRKLKEKVEIHDDLLLSMLVCREVGAFC